MTRSRFRTRNRVSTANASDPRAVTLDSIESSTCFDLDATLSDSYDGTSQTWANLVASPADGSSQTDYDFWVGFDGTSDSFEPTFNGTAGDAAAYWTTDGGDFFQLKGSNTTLLENMHQTASTQDWWMMFAYRTSAAALPTGLNFAKTRTSGNGYQLNNAGSSSPEFRDVQRNTGGTTIRDSGVNYQTASTETVVIFSMDASAQELKFWINSDTETASDTVAFSSGTAAAGIAMRLWDLGDSDIRIYHTSMGNALCDNTMAAALRAQLAIRHNRSY